MPVATIIDKITQKSMVKMLNLDKLFGTFLDLKHPFYALVYAAKGPFL